MASSDKGNVTTVDQLAQAFVQPTPESRVMVRWWWFGSTNTEKDVDQQLDAMLQAGIGGVELSYVYPVAPSQPTTYGSPRFLEVVRYAALGCKKRGMRFDMTIGSGWSFGGAHIDEAHASKMLRFEHRDIGMHAQEIPLAGRWPGDKLEGAWVCDGAFGEHTNVYEPLAVRNEVVSVPAGGSPRTLLLATSGPTTQQLKRASNGAEGPTLDHYSREATLLHLEKVGKPFFDAAGGAEYVTSVFCDSIEAYSADWTPNLKDEFMKRRGYDPIPLLYHIHTMQPDGDQFRGDYYRTLSELYEENLLVPCLDWAHKHGTKFRVQNYGAPPARLSGFKYADMIEGESVGWTKIPQSKWASSAAHHLGVNLVSAEIWTWLNPPSFKARPLDFKGEAHEHVLCGTNHFIGHGWPSSPADVIEPGWAFYAACAITDRNAWWKDAAVPLFKYLHRLGEVMRHGKPVADIGLWMPYEDTYANFVQEIELNLWKLSAKRLGERVPRELRQAGYDFDAIDAETSAESISKRHRVVVVAGSTRLSKYDIALLDKVAAKGTPIVVVDSEILPNAEHVSADELLKRLQDIIPPDMPSGHPGVGAVHRQLDNGELYFVANTDPDAHPFHLKPRTPYTRWERWDLHTGSVEHGTGDMRGSLAAYEAAVFVTTSEGDPSPSVADTNHSSTHIALHDWVLRTSSGEQTVKAPHALEEGFVGTVTYTTTVDLSSLPSRLVLDTAPLPTPSRWSRRERAFEAHAADPLGVVAALRVNGQDAGVLWDPPYSLPVGHLLRKGTNTIELAVSTTSLALQRNPEWLKIWKDAEAAHGRRFIMQEIGEVFLETRSGLLVVPELR